MIRWRSNAWGFGVFRLAQVLFGPRDGQLGAAYLLVLRETFFWKAQMSIDCTTVIFPCSACRYQEASCKLGLALCKRNF